jgi:hypothetical protein
VQALPCIAEEDQVVEVGRDARAGILLHGERGGGTPARTTFVQAGPCPREAAVVTEAEDGTLPPRQGIGAALAEVAIQVLAAQQVARQFVVDRVAVVEQCPFHPEKVLGAIGQMIERKHGPLGLCTACHTQQESEEVAALIHPRSPGGWPAR